MNMNTSKKQEGYVVVVVAALLAALTGFLALAVDIGVLYSAGLRLRRSPTRQPWPALSPSHLITRTRRNRKLRQTTRSGWPSTIRFWVQDPHTAIRRETFMPLICPDLQEGQITAKTSPPA